MSTTQESILSFAQIAAIDCQSRKIQSLCVHKLLPSIVNHARVNSFACTNCCPSNTHWSKPHPCAFLAASPPSPHRYHTSGDTLIKLARTMYIWCVYGIFGRKLTKSTVIYGAYTRFWPTEHIVYTAFLCPEWTQKRPACTLPLGSALGLLGSTLGLCSWALRLLGSALELSS